MMTCLGVKLIKVFCHSQNFFFRETKMNHMPPYIDQCIQNELRLNWGDQAIPAAIQLSAEQIGWRLYGRRETKQSLDEWITSPHFWNQTGITFSGIEEALKMTRMQKAFRVLDNVYYDPFVFFLAENGMFQPLHLKVWFG